MPAQNLLPVGSQHAVQHGRPVVSPQIDYHPRAMQTNTRFDNRSPVSQSTRQRQYQQSHHHQPQLHARNMHQSHDAAASPAPSKQHKVAAHSAVATLLSHCTVEIPLNQSQVIALTDVAGSMKELVILALGAKDGGEESLGSLKSALGSDEAVAGVVDFFSDEFEIG